MLFSAVENKESRSKKPWSWSKFILQILIKLQLLQVLVPISLHFFCCSFSLLQPNPNPGVKMYADPCEFRSTSLIFFTVLSYVFTIRRHTGTVFLEAFLPGSAPHRSPYGSRRSPIMRIRIHITGFLIM